MEHGKAENSFQRQLNSLASLALTGQHRRIGQDRTGCSDDGVACRTSCRSVSLSFRPVRLDVRLPVHCPSVSLSLSPFCLSVCLSPACLPARRLCFSCQTNFVARLAGVVLICCSFALPAAPAPTLALLLLLPLALGLSSLAQFEQILIYGYKAANGNGNLRRLLPRRLAQQN